MSLLGQAASPMPTVPKANAGSVPQTPVGAPVPQQPVYYSGYPPQSPVAHGGTPVTYVPPALSQIPYAPTPNFSSIPMEQTYSTHAGAPAAAAAPPAATGLSAHAEQGRKAGGMHHTVERIEVDCPACRHRFVAGPAMYHSKGRAAAGTSTAPAAHAGAAVSSPLSPTASTHAKPMARPYAPPASVARYGSR